MDSNYSVKYSSYLLNEDDSPSVQSFTTENDLSFKPLVAIQDWLLKSLRSTRYQVVVVALIVLDTLIVITELLLDLELSGSESQVPVILHCCSLSLLCIFILEIVIKIYAYRLKFFSMKGEVFDAIIVIIAFILDSVSLHSEDAFAGSGLIIVLRLWRVVRIQNSMVMSVHITGEKKLSKERELRQNLEFELKTTQENLKKAKQCCRDLLNLLTENGISVPSSISVAELDN